MRTARVQRETKETRIDLTLSLDGTGKADIRTGIGFFDHMLDAFCRFGLVDLTLRCDGDLHVDGHHSVEDTGICLGKALREALGDRAGIRRTGSAYMPMDESLAFCAVDISGRPFLHWDARFEWAMCGEMETALAEEFFRAVAVGAGLTLHLRLLYGQNDHHKLEALFKAFGLALRDAMAYDGRVVGVRSTKGALD